MIVNVFLDRYVNLAKFNVNYRLLINIYAFLSSLPFAFSFKMLKNVLVWLSCYNHHRIRAVTSSVIFSEQVLVS